MVSRLNLSNNQLANLLRIARAYASRITNVDNVNITAAAGRVGPNNEGEAIIRAIVRAPPISRAGGVMVRVMFKASGVIARAISGANRA